MSVCTAGLEVQSEEKEIVVALGNSTYLECLPNSQHAKITWFKQIGENSLEQYEVQTQPVHVHAYSWGQTFIYNKAKDIQTPIFTSPHISSYHTFTVSSQILDLSNRQFQKNSNETLILVLIYDITFSVGHKFTCTLIIFHFNLSLTFNCFNMNQVLGVTFHKLLSILCWKFFSFVMTELVLTPSGLWVSLLRHAFFFNSVHKL